MKFAIGIASTCHRADLGVFHCYAHDIQCQVAFNPRTITGAGMADGEDPERLWSKSRHVIAALRVSSSRVRINTLTHLKVCIGEQQGENFPSTLKTAFCRMMKRLETAQAALQTYCSTNGVTLEYVQSQAESMRTYFLNTASTQAQLEDDICEYLMAIEDMELFQEAYNEVKKICGREWMDLKLQIALRTEGRIHQGLDNDVSTLRNHVAKLLIQANQTMDDWVKYGDEVLLYKGEKTSLFEKRLVRIHLTSLRRLKRKIKRELTNRKMELDRLHSSSTVGQASFPVIPNY